ncbi:hypothetical protein D3C85_1472910 [compost metagenome]
MLSGTAACGEIHFPVSWFRPVTLCLLVISAQCDSLSLAAKNAVPELSRVSPKYISINRDLAVGISISILRPDSNLILMCCMEKRITLKVTGRFGAEPKAARKSGPVDRLVMGC